MLEIFVGTVAGVVADGMLERKCDCEFGLAFDGIIRICELAAGLLIYTNNVDQVTTAVGILMAGNAFFRLMESRRITRTTIE